MLKWSPVQKHSEGAMMFHCD